MLRLLWLSLLLSLSLLLCSQTYEVTEEQLTALETTITNQEISIEKQAQLLESSKLKIEKLEILTNLSEKIIEKQETLLQKSENKSWTDKLYNWFIGFLSGGLLVMIVTYTAL